MIKKIIENICNSLYMNTIILNIGGKANNVYLISLFYSFLSFKTVLMMSFP